MASPSPSLLASPPEGHGDPMAPEVLVRVNGADLPPDAAADVLSVEVFLDLDAPSMALVDLAAWDLHSARLTWPDDPLFDIGNELEVLFGYVGDLKSVFAGEITGLEPEFRADAAPRLAVRGHDRRHRLTRGRKTRAFTLQSDSDIAGQIALEAGLLPRVIPTGVMLDAVVQHNQSDFDFLLDRARRIGYEVAAEGTTLHFRPHSNTAAATITLEREGDLLEFCPRLTSLGQSGTTEVRGWSWRDKTSLVGSAAGADAGGLMEGSVSGPDAADAVFGATVATQVDRPVWSQAEADLVARGQLRDMALAHVAAEGLAVGRADLLAGDVIGVAGVGERFSGTYQVVSTCHTWSPRRGYRTAFNLRRNAT